MASRMFAKLDSSFNEPVWSVNNNRGEEHPKLVDHIILAEFDIDTGSTVRHQYPSEVPNYKADWFAENMLPEGAHNREKDFTYMFLHREGNQIDEPYWINPNLPPSSEDAELPFLYGINVVRNKADSSVRRGAVVKSLSLFSRYHYLQIFKRPLDLALNKYYESPSIEVLEELYDSLNSVDLSTLPRPNIIEQRIMHRGISISYSYTEKANQNDMRFDYFPSSWVAERNCTIFSEDVPLSFPLHSSPDDVGAANLTFLLKIFKENAMKIYHAILTKQRVLFIGYDHAAGDVCQMVLSAVNMVAPALPNVIRRAFPYSNLTDLSFLTVEGYIAGVTNPMFATMEGTWDLLCVLDLPNHKGTVQTVEEYKMEECLKNGKQFTPTSKFPEQVSHEGLDIKFVARLLSAIEHHVSEEWVKLQFFDYTQSLMLQARDSFHLNHFHERRMDDLIRARYEANKTRVRLLKETSEFKATPSSPWDWATKELSASSTSAAADKNQKVLARSGSVQDLVDADGEALLLDLIRLQVETEMDDSEVLSIFSSLDKCLSTESSFQVLLFLLPDSFHCLHVISSGLLHPNQAVRKHAVRLIQRMELFFSTRPAIANMNKFIKHALERQIKIQESSP